MKNENYYIGLDIGTNSVGYAVTTEDHALCKHCGEPMWGVTLFDEAVSAKKRRSFRAARRRLDRRQQRVRLVQELFAREIARVDEGFYRRIKESYLFPDGIENKVRLFDTYEAQVAYTKRYPTIHHLILELMEDGSEHDVRLVYLACAWLVAHRGHFLSEVDKDNIDAVVDFTTVYDRLTAFIRRGGEYPLPWHEGIDVEPVKEALTLKRGITQKAQKLSSALFGANAAAPKTVNEQYEYNYDLVVKLLCGGKVRIKDLFNKESYAELDEPSVSLGLDDEKLALILQSLDDDDDVELIRCLKQVYDWSVLVDALGGKETMSAAKVAVYERHREDLRTLKYFIRKYAPDKYKEVFRSQACGHNYAAYTGQNKIMGQKEHLKKASKEDFCKYIRSIWNRITVDDSDRATYEEVAERLAANAFLPKQVDGDNRVIPYQLYYYEMKKLLENAAGYLPFLHEPDGDGLTVTQKLLAVFEYRIPYYVGPLKEHDDKLNHWMVRREAGEIFPWNFNDKVDLDRCEEAFIQRMTNACTYLPGENVLPKCSLLYSAFEVLGEINNITVDGVGISVEAKQSLYHNVFMRTPKVTPKRITDYLRSINEMGADSRLGGLDVTVKSSLRPHIQFRRLISEGHLTCADAERIIERAAYSEDKARLSRWIKKEYPDLSDADVRYLASLPLKGFGRLSKKLLCGIEGALNPHTGEYMTVIRAMWETNSNFMQLMSDRYDFKENIEEAVKDYYGTRGKTVSARLDDMRLPNAVKRSIVRTLDIVKDIVKVQKRAPEKIFVEMARGGKPDEKGKPTVARLQQIQNWYREIMDEDVRELQEELEALGEEAQSKLQSDKLYLYFMQLGRCLYTNQRMNIWSVLTGDGTYNIEHIYPRCFVKDDSVLQNKILVDSQANMDKGDTYPIDGKIQEKMAGYWNHLHKFGLISDEKYKRLTRKTAFTEEEKFEFINRQLVETRQSSKAVASLLKEQYPDTEIVYVKASLASDFRQTFGLPKSREVNDLHHAKDAYLNIVVGHVWHSKFSRQFWLEGEVHNAKPEVVFSHPVVCGGKTVWRGAADKDRVISIAKKNAVHMTMYAYCRHSGQNGGFYDQNPIRAAEGLVPMQKDRPTEIYGGYDNATISFFILVKYFSVKKQDVVFMPVELLFADKFLSDGEFAAEYIKQTVSKMVNKPVDRYELPLGHRIIKINTMLSLDGFRMCIKGKSSNRLSLSSFTPFKTSFENEAYVKKLSNFVKKTKDNDRIRASETYDGISKERNLALYDVFAEKLQAAPYRHRPNNPAAFLISNRDCFVGLEAGKQAEVLLAILGLLGRAGKADLTAIDGKPYAGVTLLSASLSNWKKTYTDVRIIDQSASGLFEKVSEVNLLDLL